VPNTIHDVFRNLVEVDEENTTRDVAGIISYGLFWADLEAWINHRVSNGNPHPSAEEINQHIQNNLTANYFRDLESKSLQLFGEASLTFLEERIEAEKEEAVRKSLLDSMQAHNAAVLSEVSKGSNFYRQTFMALLTAIVAPLILGAILVAIKYYSDFATPRDVETQLAPPIAAPKSP
jgi:hypothetical protein